MKKPGDEMPGSEIHPEVPVRAGESNPLSQVGACPAAVQASLCEEGLLKAARSIRLPLVIVLDQSHDELSHTPGY